VQDDDPATLWGTPDGPSRLTAALACVIAGVIGAATMFIATGGLSTGTVADAANPPAVAARPPLVGQSRAATASSAHARSTPTPDPTTDAPTAGPTTSKPVGGSGGSGGGGGGGPTTTTTAPVVPPTTNPPPPTTPPPPTDVTVPNVYGLSERDAWQRLTGLGLTVTESQVGTASQCYVIDQTPDAGSVVAVGATVHIVVAIQLGPFCGVA
jgi:hypothetical protein